MSLLRSYNTGDVELNEVYLHLGDIFHSISQMESKFDNDSIDEVKRV